MSVSVVWFILCLSEEEVDATKIFPNHRACMSSPALEVDEQDAAGCWLTTSLCIAVNDFSS